MNKRIIPVELRDEYVLGAGVAVGAQGSGGDVVLQMEFGPMWDGLVKYVTFRDALGENPVVTLLTTNMIERVRIPKPPEADGAVGRGDGPFRPARTGEPSAGQEPPPCPESCPCCPAERPEMVEKLVYNVPVPAQSKAVAGKMMVTVHGYSLNADGSQVETATMSATAYFRVLPAEWSMPEDEGFEPPTLAQQMQAQIEDIRKDIVEVAKVADGEVAREVAEALRQAAEKEREAAEELREEGEAARDQAEAERAAAERLRKKAEEIRDAAEEAREAAEEARADEHTGLVAQAAAQADRAAREADRAKQAAGAEFLTAIDMEDQLAEHLLMGEAERMKTMPIGSALFVTDGEMPEGLVTESDIEKSWGESY